MTHGTWDQLLQQPAWHCTFTSIRCHIAERPIAAEPCHRLQQLQLLIVLGAQAENVSRQSDDAPPPKNSLEQSYCGPTLQRKALGHCP